MKFAVRIDGDRMVIALNGAFHRYSSRWSDFSAIAARTLRTRLTGGVEIDLGGVDYIDCASIGKIVRFGERLKETGRRLAVINLRPEIRDAFRMLRVHKLLACE